MRRVAASVTVVTTSGAAGCAGATVSAFSSVSADPPMVLICLNAEGRIARMVAANGRFCVNVLPEDGHHIAERFAGRHDASIADRFEGIPCLDPGGEGPQIDGATSFACTLDQTVHSGSHLVLFGRVQRVTDAARKPLTYHDGAYRRVAENEMHAAPN
jgi:flavin reductase (DIM6/NTAB) family NADH-FMN oxidoreductase RutF